MSELIHRFEHDGKRYDFVHDAYYTVERTCGGIRQHSDHCDDTTEYQVLLPGETESKSMTAREECEFFYQREVKKLDDGDWVVVGCVEYVRCPNDPHCGACSGWEEGEHSVWGIVIENATKAMEQYAKEGM